VDLRINSYSILYNCVQDCDADQLLLLLLESPKLKDDILLPHALLEKAVQAKNLKAVKILLNSNRIPLENSRLILYEAQNELDIFDFLISNSRIDPCLNLYIETFFSIDSLPFTHKRSLLESLLNSPHIKLEHIQSLLNQSVINWGPMCRIPLEDHLNIIRRLLAYPDIDPNKALPSSKSKIYWWQSTGEKVPVILETLIDDPRIKIINNLDTYFEEHPEVLTEQLQLKIEQKKEKNGLC